MEQEKNSMVRPVFTIIIYIIGVILLTVSFSGLILPLLQRWGMSDSSRFVYYIVSECCLLLSVVAMACFMLRVVDHRPLSDLGLTLRGHGKDIGYGMLWAFVLLSLGFQTMLAFGVVEVAGVHFYPVDFVVSWFFFVMVALAEEIMMRGFILEHLLRSRMNKYLALLLSSFVFAAGHLFNPDIALLPMLNLVLAGLLLGASFLYTRNLWFPISFHLFWNWIQGPVFGYEVSGNSFGKTLLTLNLLESNFVNGGAFGFEGSIVCTTLVVLFTAGIIWWNKRRQGVTL